MFYDQIKNNLDKNYNASDKSLWFLSSITSAVKLYTISKMNGTRKKKNEVSRKNQI